MAFSHRIILDCDPGVDDAIAILLTLASPEIDLVGITCVTGNKDLPLTARNALRTCAIVGRQDVPVLAGSPRPLMGPYHRKWPSVHGEDGLCDLDLPGEPGRLRDEHAVDFIIREILAAPGDIALCVIGPMTNIALAILKEPRIVSAIASIVFMGGAAFCPGNSTPLAEFNFLVDPEAAEIVLSSGVPLVMLGLDVTGKAKIEEHHLAALEHGRGPGAKAAAALLRAYGSKDPCLHDPCAIMYCLAPDLFTGVDAHVTVLQHPAEARGSVVASVSERHRDGRATNCYVVTDCLVGEVFEQLLRRLSTDDLRAILQTDRAG